jgi:hypothetical protein
MPENEYVPFKAINVFMNRNYLEKVIKEILEGIKTLSRVDQTAFNQLFRKYVTVLGFRNPVRAPLSLQINAYSNAFEEKDEVIPITLSLWTKLKSDFAVRVKDWLESEGWNNLALERVFTEDGGFILGWPKKLTFDKLVEKYKKAYPDDTYDRDDLILMVLWISGNLPKEQAEL